MQDRAVVSGYPLAAPFGGRRAMLGANPIAAGFPLGARRAPMIVDFATTVVAEGKVRVARDAGEQLAPGAILDREGRPSTDPNDFYDGGMLLPFGGHKGYALALTAEMLAAALVAPALWAEEGRGGPVFGQSGLFMLAINPAIFGTRDDYYRIAEDTLERMKGVPPAPGFAEVLIPGEPEARARAQRSRDGIPLAAATWQALAAVAAELGIDAEAQRHDDGNQDGGGDVAMDESMQLSGWRIIDLTQMYEPGIPVPPGQAGPQISRTLAIADGAPVNAESFSIALHTGTHVDAPYHFFSDLGTTDVVDTPDRLIGRGIVLDMSHKRGWQPICADDIRAWEDGAGVRIAGGDIVLVRTDHWRAWMSGAQGLDYVHGGWPYFIDDAVEYLASKPIKALGVETMDPDKVDFADVASSAWPTHRTFLKAGIPIMENLCHLDAIGAPTCTFIGLPLKIKGVSGAPLRAIAIVR